MGDYRDLRCTPPAAPHPLYARAELGLTNAYVAQLFFNQAQLKPETAGKLKRAVPQLR